jgi:ribosomal-protein-alanine N-acetyltransferase
MSWLSRPTGDRPPLRKLALEGREVTGAIDVVAETDRLVLRLFTPADAGFILRLLNEPSFIENIGDKQVRTLEQASRYLVDGPIESYHRHGHGLYLVGLKGSGTPIGMCGLLKREQLQDVDLGYAFLPEFWSSGYAYESASAVLKLGRQSLGLSTIVAVVSPGNAASIKLLRKLGFSFARSAKLEPNAPDVSLYELRLADDSTRR